MSLQQTEDVRIVANDLEIYFKGFEVALKRKQVDDATRYLESMIEEIDYTADRLQWQKHYKDETEKLKSNIKKMITEQQNHIERLKVELARF
ncbi:MAG: hypothetical protein MN733_09770 [Nitrososphaera sp.]|nr:hypothetical protein [Nitrososphaera sp.]